MSGFPMAGSCSKEPMEYCGESAGGAAVLATVQQLVPLDFTHVVYDAAHPHSLVLAYLTFLPILVGLSLINAVVLRRDLEAAFHSCGLLLSSLVNAVVKRIVQQPRPVGSAKLGHGMPSDHAQFSFFFVVYLSYWLVYRARLSRRERTIWIVLMVALALVVCWSRIHLGVHSPAQVLAGASIGCALGALWGAWARVCVWQHILPLIERSAFGRRWNLKDCSPASLPAGITSSLEFEYRMYTTNRGQHAAPAGATSSCDSPLNGVAPVLCQTGGKKLS